MCQGRTAPSCICRETGAVASEVELEAWQVPDFDTTGGASFPLENPVVVERGGGHAIPASPEVVSQVAGFLRRQSTVDA